MSEFLLWAVLIVAAIWIVGMPIVFVLLYRPAGIKGALVTAVIWPFAPLISLLLRLRDWLKR